MTKNKNERKHSRSSYKRRSDHRVFNALLAVFGVIILGVIGYFVYQKFFKKDEVPVSDIRDRNTAIVAQNNSENPDSNQEDQTDSNSSKTLSEKEQEDWTKNQEKNEETGLTIAKPVIDEVYFNDEGSIEIAGTITNVTNSEGTCTYVFSNGSASFEKTKGVNPPKMMTECQQLYVNLSEFTPGEWTVTLKYKSNSAEGTSDAKTFTIQ